VFWDNPVVQGKKKEERMKASAGIYVHTPVLPRDKIKQSLPHLPVLDVSDLATVILLEYCHFLPEKHIDLVDRRLLKGEKIPQEEKMFSIFESCTEWITKGKLRPNVEPGKKVNITTDRYHLIADYQTMDHRCDSDLVIVLADRLTSELKVKSWSFDKGYWHPDNRALPETVIPEVIMPKKGKCNKEESEREAEKSFKKLRNPHSAIESNLHSPETGGYHAVRTGAKHISTVMSAGRYVHTICVVLGANCKQTVATRNFFSQEQRRK
jgi:hypothetical protein